jgi:hypothetical protein
MKNNLENINDVFLKDLGNNGGFKTPTGYFENSKANILSKINADPSLKIIKNEGGFTIPTDYFETSKFQVLNKINSQQAKKVNLFSVANWQLISGIAAIFIAIITIFIFVPNKNTTNLNANLNNISEADMIDYLANNDVKIEWINEINVEPKTTLKKEENNKEIEQYLLEHADEQALIDEL